MGGTKKTTILIRNSVLLAMAAAMILHVLPATLFTLTLIPLGFTLNRSAAQQQDEIVAGAKGLVVLGVTWIAYWTVYGTLMGMNPYLQLLQVLDNMLVQAFELYSTGTNISSDTLLAVQQVVGKLRTLLPKALPGILACTLLLTVWINLVGSLTTLERLKPEAIPWKKYSDWRLPEKLIWLPIIAGIFWITGTDKLYGIGLSLILVSILLYFFQGLAVFIFFIDRWNVPLYMKIIIYGIGILIFGSYGLLLLSVTGIADVWIDFRSRVDNESQPDS